MNSRSGSLHQVAHRPFAESYVSLKETTGRGVGETGRPLAECSVGELFMAVACTAEERTLFRTASGLTISYGEAMIKVANAVHHLGELGLTRGDAVVCYLDETIASGLFALACASSGIVPVPLGPVFSVRHLKKMADRLNTRFVFTTVDLAPHVMEGGMQPICFSDGPCPAYIASLGSNPGFSAEEAREFLLDLTKNISSYDVFMIQPTSGSTGEPKLVARRHKGFTRYAEFVGNEIHSDDPIPPRFLAVAALTHAFGLHMFTTALSLGGELCVPRQIDTSAELDEIRALDPSVLPTTPRVLRSLYRQYLAGDRDRPFFGPAARVLLTAGGKSDEELLRFVESGGVDTIEFYGSSEASIVGLSTRGARREGSAGRIVSDCEARIAEDGELLVRSPGLMSGYFLDDGLTNQSITDDGYYRTGDLAKISDNGHLHILGRKRDLFNTPDGSNIYPERIETAIESLPWVKQAMLIGDQRPYLSVIIVVEGEFDVDGLGSLSTEQFAHMYERAGRDLARLNAEHERMERVVCFTLLARPFDPTCYSVVGTGKIRRDRRAFLVMYEDEIARLYSSKDIPRDSVILVPPRERRFNPEARSLVSMPAASPTRSGRNHPRVATRVPLSILAQGRWSELETENLSLGGALVRTADRWPVDSQVDVVLTHEGRPAKGRARVVYLHQGGVGLAFVNSDEHFSGTIARILEEKLSSGERFVERRARPRKNVQLRVSIFADATTRERVTVNLSSSGVLVRCACSELREEAVTLSFLDHPGLTLSGRVVGRRESDVGIAFVSLTTAEQTALDRIVECSEAVEECPPSTICAIDVAKHVAGHSPSDSLRA
jgi:long-subunit acyl-CoA synthetase (AMP-forming)